MPTLMRPGSPLCRLDLAIVARSALGAVEYLDHPAQNLFSLRLCERPQSLSPHIVELAGVQSEHRQGLVVGRFHDKDDIVTTERPEQIDHLRADFLRPTRRRRRACSFRHVANALVGELSENA